MKHLGIDFGTKKIGIALSDNRGVIAFPKTIIPYSQNLVQDILRIIKEEAVEKIVIGKSLNPWGSENSLQKDIDGFANKLSQNLETIEIVQQDERGSSIAARAHLYGKGNIAHEKWGSNHNQKKREDVDAGAAAVILQRYLDKK